MEARLERVEGEAFGSLYESAGMPVLRIAGAVCYATPGLPESAMLNHVVGLGLDGDPGDAVLDEIDAFFRAAGTGYAVALARGADPGLARRLAARGFAPGYAWMKFHRGPEPPAAARSGLRVELTDDGPAFGRTVVAAYGMPSAAAGIFAGIGGLPDWSLFLAYDGDEPVGGAALFARDGVGWLGGAGTLPAHRGKGAQSALFAARIARARELGLDALTTETGERVPDRPSASYRNILRAGFAEAHLRPNLAAPTR